MLPDLDEWDLATVADLAAAAVDESAELEKKASDKLDVSTNAGKSEALAEIGKQVCAFANAGGGFILFGVRDGKAAGGLDAGVPELVGRQPVREWIEAKIPSLVTPCRTEAGDPSL